MTGSSIVGVGSSIPRERAANRSRLLEAMRDYIELSRVTPATESTPQIAFPGSLG